MNSQRWQTAIHESGHGVACVVLGGVCTRLAILPDGSGLAFNSCLSPFARAVSVAAGPTAELRLADCPPPATEPTPQAFDVVQCEIPEPTAAERLESIAARYPDGSVPTDAQTVAHFCIRGFETRPEKWVSRFDMVQLAAGELIRDHQTKILAVAAALFARGILTETEILELCR